jgi:hypothetical protein
MVHTVRKVWHITRLLLEELTLTRAQIIKRLLVLTIRSVHAVLVTQLDVLVERFAPQVLKEENYAQLDILSKTTLLS